MNYGPDRNLGEELKTIPLVYSTYYVVLVDDEDYDWLKSFRWRRLQVGDNMYACTKKSLYMHRMIIYRHSGVSNIPDGLEIDHKNNNGLDNQKDNLRLATRSQNNANRSPNSNIGESKYRGVWLRSRFDRPGEAKWIAEIRVNYIKKVLGTFNTQEEAAEAWNKAAIEAWGEYAVLNHIK